MSRSTPTLVLLALAAAALGGSGARAAAADAGVPFPRVQLEKFAARAARRDGLSRRAILKVLTQAREQPHIIDEISRPAEGVLEWW
ncbi:MAG: hypothetical protein ACRETZ_16280, partial [Steroidobacteraceae bacterium]